MYTIVNLYSSKSGEISKFLSKYFDKQIHLESDLKWEKKYENSIEIADIIGAFIVRNRVGKFYRGYGSEYSRSFMAEFRTDIWT